MGGAAAIVAVGTGDAVDVGSGAAVGVEVAGILVAVGSGGCVGDTVLVGGTVDVGSMISAVGVTEGNGTTGTLVAVTAAPGVESLSRWGPLHPASRTLDTTSIHTAGQNKRRIAQPSIRYAIRGGRSTLYKPVLTTR